MTDRPLDRRDRIAAAFDGADRYEDAAVVQRASAAALAERIAAEPVAADPRILELGCGTGFLTRALAERLSGARWTISDIAPAMVARARAGSNLAGDYRVIDGEAVDPGLGRFDLIASNMAFQWFGDLPGAVARLTDRLAPGGLLAFSTMVAGSFAEWGAALKAEGVGMGTPDYPDAAGLRAMSPAGLGHSVDVVDFAQSQVGAADFLRQLKTIGAGTPAPGYRPVSPAALRRAMARFDAGPRVVTYRIGFCLIRQG